MAKEILKLLDNVKRDLEEGHFDLNGLTLSMLIYDVNKARMSTGQLRFKLSDVLVAVEVINSKLNSVTKLKKRVKALEKKLKK